MVSRLILSKATAIRGVGAPRVVSFGARSLATSTDKGMHVTELTDKVSEAHHLTKAESKRIISTIFDSITEACANKKKVRICFALPGWFLPNMLYGYPSFPWCTDHLLFAAVVVSTLAKCHRQLIAIVFYVCSYFLQVSISGFGIFETVHANARKGRNPQTGEPLEIAARERIRFRPSKTFKDAVQPEK